jgi:hypothetical protein
MAEAKLKIAQKTKAANGNGIRIAKIIKSCMSIWLWIIRLGLRIHASASLVKLAQPYASGLAPPQWKKQIAIATLKTIGINLSIHNFQATSKFFPSFSIGWN